MVGEEPDLDLSEEKERSPWLIILGIVIVTIALGAWIMRARARQDSAVAALEQQRAAQKTVLDQERDKVLDLTKQLDTLRIQINAKQAGDPKEAVARYNALAAQQREQREKVRTLADQYNQTVQKIHDLQ